MRAVFNREFRAIFRTPVGYVFFAAFILFTGLFATCFNFVFGSSALEYTLVFLAPALALLLPILSIGIVGAEDREGTNVLLHALPLRSVDVFFGKFLSALAALALACVAPAILPLIFSMYGEVNFASAYSAVAAFVLLELVLLCAEFLVAVCIRKRPVCFIVSYALPILLYILSLVTQYLPFGVKGAIDAVSLFGLYTSFEYGLFDIKAVVLYLSLSAVLLTLSYIKYAKSFARGEVTR